MKFAAEFRDRELVAAIVEKIGGICRHDWTLMEFCGTHTVAIFRHGLKSLLPERLRLVSGPGCPVCVTGRADIDRILYLSGLPGSIVATYGDMMKVPGSTMNLSERRARGADIRIVYSSYDAVALAERNPDKRVFFIGIGFETTAPSTAAAVLRAAEAGLKNFFVLALHKRTPPVVGALIEHGTSVDGFICPGHVCSIIGAKPLEPVASVWKKPCVVAGFEPSDVLQAIYMLLRQLEEGRSEVEIEYLRGVSYDGNANALAAIDKVFATTSSEWRGIGMVKDTGLALRDEFSRLDAAGFIDSEIESLPDPAGCKCGDVLRGDMIPPHCPLFGKTCTPQDPIGPCMVSSEGSCAAYYQYAGERHE
ncbi:MAG: hydrogenase formation protein HypD [Candidatus Eisenbacteria bacterium]